jgi:hypothetical protein
VFCCCFLLLTRDSSCAFSLKRVSSKIENSGDQNLPPKLQYHADNGTQKHISFSYHCFLFSWSGQPPAYRLCVKLNLFTRFTFGPHRELKEISQFTTGPSDMSGGLYRIMRKSDEATHSSPHAHSFVLGTAVINTHSNKHSATK